MAERRTMKSWGARLNAEDEPLTMEEAMLLSLGHLNARLEIMTTHLGDMRSRLTRLEKFAQLTIPGYDDHVRMMLEREEQEKREREQKALVEAS